MRISIAYGIFFTVILSSTYLQGQISPGKLSDAHAHLEGLGNCTQCHDLGNQVPNQKCLDCHNEIESLINANRGFHSSSEVSSMDCIDCHNEHHGRKFEMIRFDEESFDHSQTGYNLLGQHKVTDCRDCHKPDHIRDVDLKKRENTFLGLEAACLNCHDDYHQQTLDNDCLKCHTYDSFESATKFDHDQADFNLRGAHVQVDCKECHPISIKNGKDFQQFTDIPFNRCTDCHSDAHNGNLTASCTDCHTETSFSNFIGQGRFNHNTTNFELRGSHSAVNCFECHSETVTPATVFQDLLAVTESNCLECHDDVHEGKFGTDCNRCHTEESFYALKDMSLFDHNVTNYPLEGMHVGVDCKQCHKERYTESIDFSYCKNCHEDYHNGEFTSTNKEADCIDCHTLEEAFTYTTYGFDEHNASIFPLEGAHMATPCFSCHVDENHWSFRNIGQSCIDCHDDIHQEVMDQKYYPDKDCTVCHNSDSWQTVSFDHDLTEWPLTGKHTVVNCRDCHFDTADDGSYRQNFASLNTECIQCHENIHGNQFEVENVTNCIRCHNSESWTPNNFDHNNTNFPLDGKHVDVDCYECHKNTQEVDGKSITIFKIEKYECIDCHL